ncbi:hypothetical protein [Microtetraspora malaysiensis]|uniref:Uncharacterized protein n=1 Tax=Microtetraspora malaysiensis TaxID=161358 RepID=A0ABW6T182_9ACTN
MRKLAGDDYTGRRVGTPGGRAAAAWLAEQLRELGAKVELAPFPVTGVRELYDTPVLEWSVGGQTRRLERRREFVEHLASAEMPQPHTAPLTADADADVRGRWVLAEAGDWAQACARAEAGGAGCALICTGTWPTRWPTTPCR